MEERILGPDVDFAALICQLRTNVGMTQAEACRRSGVKADVWSRVERNQYVNMSWRTAVTMLNGVGWKMKLVADNAKES